MDNDSKNSKKKALEYAFGKLVDQWPLAVTFLAGGGYVTYLASVSAWMGAYGPVAWAGAGLFALLLLALAYYAYALARHRLILSNLVAMRANSTKTNLLAPLHEHEKLELHDFYDPSYLRVDDVRFNHCHLLGPISIALRDCTVAHCVFAGCEVVLVNPGVIKNVLAMQRCFFMETRFQGVTLYMTLQEWNSYGEEFRSGLTVISTGVPG